MDDMIYVRNTRNLTHMSSELKRIIDDYWQGKVSESTLKEYIHYVAENAKLLSDNGRCINITVGLKIGKRRVDLVMKMLEDYQLRLL